MPASVDQFGKAVVTSGLLSPAELRALWAEIPADKKPPDGERFAAILRERGLLNDFQASELLSGRDTPLVLNQYVLVSKIGAGGMGQVFKAQHRKMKRLVAIKLLPSSMTKDEAAIKRFQREVEAAAKLTHPNIVAALDADECRGMHYLVMEYVEGQDLSAVVKKQGPLSVSQSIDFILQAARGLAYAHAEGVVHRDIKPANLLVDKKGVVKILDMGLARIEGMGDAADHQLTNTGQVMGTVDYMAPEQATDTRMADARSDVYSLGCSLYRLLTGGNVYDGDTLIKKIMSHMHDAIPSLRAKRPDAPAELDRIFAKMMAKKPEDRYQQTSQLVAELEALRSPGGAPSQPSVVEQDSELQRFLSGVKDSKTNAPTATKAAVAPASATNVDEATAAFSSADATTDPKSELIAPAVIASAQKAAAGGRAPRAKSSKSKSPPIKLIAAGALGVVLVLFGIVVLIRDDKGNKVAEVVVPPGGSVEVKQAPPTPVAPATAVPKAIAPPPKSNVPSTGASSAPTVNFTGRNLLTPSVVDLHVQRDAQGFVRDAAGLILDHTGVGVATPVMHCQSPSVWNTDETDLTADVQELALPDPEGYIRIGFEKGRAQLSLVLQGKPGSRMWRINSTADYTSSDHKTHAQAPAKESAGGVWKLRVRYDQGTFEGYANDELVISAKNVDFVPTTAVLSARKSKWLVRSFQSRRPVTTPSPVTGSTSAADFALHLKDRNDGVEAPNPGIDLLRPFTVEAYVTPGTIPASGISDAQIVGMNGCRLDVFKSGWSWYCYHSTIHAPAPIVSGRRVHLAGVRTLNQLLLYVDGKLVASKDEPIQAQPDPKPTPLKIAPSTANFLFKIDELRITQGTPYTQDFTPPARFTADKDTLLLYHFDEGQGDVVNDSSGKNLHGKLTGGQWVRLGGNSPSTALTSTPTWTFGEWKSLFDSQSLAGWTGETDKLRVENGVLVNDGQRGVVMAPGTYSDCEVELEFRLQDKGNSGLGICYSGNGDPSKEGLEIQLLDDPSQPNVGPDQRCGSIYRLTAVQPGPYKKWPEWNRIAVRSVGDDLEVVLNGASVVKTTRKLLAAAYPTHAGIKRNSGSICLFPHTSRSEYRNFRVREATKGVIASELDLLTSVDLARDASLGTWKQVGDGIAGENSNGASMLQVPYQPPEEYDMEVEFTPTGPGLNVNLYLVSPETSFAWKLNAHARTPPLYGFELLDGKFTKDRQEATTQLDLPLQVGKRYRTVVEVRKGSLRGLLDGRELVKWSGDLKRLSMETATPLKHPGRIGVGSWKRAVTFHSVKVREVAGKGKLFATSTPAAIALTAPSEVDLLSGVDVNRDAVLGKFTLAGGLKQTDNVFQARIYLPTTSLPAEYDLHFTVARTAPGGKAFMIGFVSQGKQGSVVIDGFSNPPASGLEMVDGKSAKENGTYQSGERITFGSKHEIVVRVRDTGISVSCDGAAIFDWKGKASQLSTHAMWDVPRKDQLFVGFQGPYVVHAARLIPMGAAPVGLVSPAANVVYLDELTEKSYFGLKDSFVKPGRNPSDAASWSRVFPGAPLVHALHVHPDATGLDKERNTASAMPSHKNTSRLVYDLDGKYALFQSGFRSRTGSTSLQAEVWGDGRPLWQSGVPIAQHPADTTAEVDVRGIRELTLFTWCDDGKSHVLLTEPRLTPLGQVSPAAGVVYLDDLPEIEWKDGNGKLGKHGLDRVDIPFTRQGKAFTHALFTHPLKDKAGIVRYALDGKFETLAATVGLADITEDRAGSAIQFRVLGDGRELWKSHQIQKPTDEATFSVSVVGVRELQLEVATVATNSNKFAHAVWLDPRLTPIAAPSTTPGGSSGANLPGIVYLDDLPEKDWQGHIELGKHGDKWKQDGSVINWQGAKPAHALTTYPLSNGSATVTYELGGRYSAFQAVVGITVTPRTPLTFRVFGDGKILWESQPQTKRVVSGVEVNVDLRGVETLKLEVLCPGDNNSAHAVWIDPRLTPTAQPEPPGVVYLDDLTETESRVLADLSLGKHGKYRDQGKDEETTILWRGKPITHSLWMHPPRAKDAVAFARYQLEGKYQTFAADAGIQENMIKDPSSPVTFRVLGDGRELWKSPPLQKRGESAEVSVDVRGVKELRLEASSGEKNGNCHATWFMPRLTLVNDQRAGGVSLPMSPSTNTTSNPNNAGVPSNSATNTASSSSSATAPRWPLAPSQPADIQKLLDAKAEVTVRVDATKEVKLKSGDKLPAGPATIVGVTLFGNQNKADDALLEFLATLTDLEDLNFSTNAHAATPAGVQKLAALKNLRRLSLNGLKNQADGVSDVLKSLPRLEYLYLPFGKRTSEEWAKAASTITTITEINTYRCDLTETGLAHLEKMSQLTIVSLVDNGDLTQAAIERFAAAVPSCRVQWGADKDRKWIEPRSITSSSLDRQVAQRLLDLKLPVKLIIADKKSFVKPGSSLPVEPFVIEGIDSGAWAAVARAELVKLLGEFRQLTSVENTFLPMKDCDLWAETFAAMPSIKAVVAARCDELTDVGAAHLARLPKLEYLNIGSSVKLTATGLAAFESCKTLTTIELCPEAVTAGSYTLADIQKLQNALPKTRIVFGGVKPIPGLVKPTN